MKIRVQDGEHTICLHLPTGLVLNRVGAAILCKKAGKYGIQLKYSQLVKLLRALNHYRRTHKDWVFAEVTCADGESIQIRL